MSALRNWRELAACAGVATADDDPFFPDVEDEEATARALALCGRCRVRRDCLDYAVRTTQRHGIWGGHPQRELRRLVEQDRRGRTCASRSAANHRNARKTRCHNGHPFDVANTYYAPGGQRRCRICRREASRRSWRRAADRRRSG